MRSLSRFSFFAAMAVAAIVMGVFAGLVFGDRLSSLARASTASNLTTLSIREDRFRNYDFNSQTDSSTNVDWAMSMLFYNNANINKVKNFYHSGYPYGGGGKNARLDDGSGWVWDGDGGIKDVARPTYQQQARHMRLYADSDDRLYNVDWGYYVIGSTHKDWQEFWVGSQFGWSEETEGIFAAYARNHGWTVYEDWSYWNNYERPYWEGNHYWDNNGYATAVYVP